MKSGMAELGHRFRKFARRVGAGRWPHGTFYLHVLGIGAIATTPIVLSNIELPGIPDTATSFDRARTYAVILVGSALLWLFGFDARRISWSIGAGDSARLTVSQQRQLAAVMHTAFTFDRLATILKIRLARDIESVVDGGAGGWAERVVDAAFKEGWLAELVEAAQQAHPNDAGLATIRVAAGLGVQIEDRDELERIINKRAYFRDISEFILQLTRAESAVCRISYPVPGARRVYGTGFLVGPDLLLTNYHVVEPILEGTVGVASVTCLFDYHTVNGVETRGATCGVKDILDRGAYAASDQGASIELPAADELDFALLRLDRPIGAEPISEPAEEGAPARGWITLPDDRPELGRDDPVFLLQHPSGDTKKLTFGAITDIAEMRVRYNANTLSGSSGSPCFTTAFELFGMHHAGDPDFSEKQLANFNQAVPIHLIARRIAAFIEGGGDRA